MSSLMTTEQQIKYLIWSPVAIAPFSILGSGLTVLSLFRIRAKKGSFLTYHRLILGVSVFDLIFSLAMGLGPLMMPAGKSLFGFETLGNHATCVTQAFLLQLGHGAFTYNMFLLLYYVLIIRYNLPDTLVRSRIEPVLHFLGIGFHLGVAVAGLFLNVYVSLGGLCTSCGRGPHATLFQIYLTVVPLGVSTGLMLVFLAVLAWTVWRRNRKRQRFVFERSLATGVSPSTATGNRAARDATDRRSQMVISQCFWYGGTMTNAVLASLIVRIMIQRDAWKMDYFPVHFVAVLFFPLQGLFNFLIYIRPSYAALRARNMSRYRALVEAVLYPVDTPAERQSRVDRVRSTTSSSTISRFLSRMSTTIRKGNSSSRPGGGTTAEEDGAASKIGMTDAAAMITQEEEEDVITQDEEEDEIDSTKDEPDFSGDDEPPEEQLNDDASAPKTHEDRVVGGIVVGSGGDDEEEEDVVAVGALWIRRTPQHYGKPPARRHWRS